MFEGFFEFVSGVLAFFYDLTNSFGIALILLTIVVMILTAPLTLTSTRSMVQMQRLQPEMKRLQNKYKDDRETLNKELMAFYQANNINPLMGCVPVLLQAPIFFILYQVIRGVTTRVGGNGSPIGHITGELLTSQGLTTWERLEQPFSPIHLKATTTLYTDLTQSNSIRFFGMDLAVSPSEAVRLGLLTAIPFVLLMLGLFGSQLIQNRQIQGRNASGQTNPQQQMMMKVLPFMLPVFSFSFPAGLGVYYFVQGLCRIGLQHYITRNIYGPDHHEHVERIAKENKQLEEEIKAGKASKKDGADGKDKAASRGKGSSDPPKKQSDRSKAAQRKAEGGGSTKTPGRKSGAPRSGSSRGSGSDNPK